MSDKTITPIWHSDIPPADCVQVGETMIIQNLGVGHVALFESYEAYEEGDVYVDIKWEDLELMALKFEEICQLFDISIGDE